MGKLRYDPNCYQQSKECSSSSSSIKMMQKTPKKTVKITYISSPVLIRACDASEFRSVVQQLTGKDSNNVGHCSTLTHGERVMQGVRGSEDGGQFHHYNTNRSMVMSSSVELDEDYFWKELSHFALPSPCLLA